MKKPALKIFIYLLLIVFFVLLIPIFKNDYILSLIYIVLIGIYLIVDYVKKDYLFLLFGLIGMTLSEILFVSTGVEHFVRDSLFGLMPMWLPILWAFAFVMMRRIVTELDKC
ncbi:MAG: hypothetical protein ACKKL6_03080 [Candidatus Komeilibacteria bacterium]